jgi:nickel/cobalt transporter (NicO) family protein
MNSIIGLTAFFLGALHALEPGHGKAAIAAYAVGYRSNMRQVLVLGLTTAIAHTATILLLALIIGATLTSVAGEQMQQWIEVGSACLLLGTGAWLWRRALKNRAKADDCNMTENAECGCRRPKNNTDKKEVSYGVVSLLGISVGLLQ